MYTPENHDEDQDTPEETNSGCQMFGRIAIVLLASMVMIFIGFSFPPALLLGFIVVPIVGGCWVLKGHKDC